MVVVVILFVCLFVFNLELPIYGERGGWAGAKKGSRSTPSMLHLLEIENAP